MKPPIDRHEYGRIYNQLFKDSDREDCRQGWNSDAGGING
jgi:hypothetical protein